MSEKPSGQSYTPYQLELVKSYVEGIRDAAIQQKKDANFANMTVSEIATLRTKVSFANDILLFIERIERISVVVTTTEDKEESEEWDGVE